MVRVKIVDTYPKDGPLLGARKLAKSLGTLTPARELQRLLPEGFDSTDPTENSPGLSSENPELNSSDAEYESEDEPVQPATSFWRRPTMIPRPEGPLVTKKTPSSEPKVKKGVNGNRDLEPGRILTTISYVRNQRKIMCGIRWTEEADLLILYLRRNRIPFRRITSQFIFPMTGHELGPCQTRWTKLKSVDKGMSAEDLARLEEEMQRIEREQFPHGIPPEPPAPPAAPTQDGSSGHDQKVGGSDSSASVEADTRHNDSNSSLSSLNSPTPTPPPDYPIKQIKREPRD